MLFLKSSESDPDYRLPLRERLILIYKERVEKADNDKDRARAKRDLAEIQGRRSARELARTDGA